jgi:hypothetical protein
VVHRAVGPAAKPSAYQGPKNTKASDCELK